MSKMSKNVLFVLSISGLGLLVSGCTIPYYGRTVEKRYDANGKLIETVVREEVRQSDPNAKPLLPVLESQNYQK